VSYKRVSGKGNRQCKLSVKKELKPKSGGGDVESCGSYAYVSVKRTTFRVATKLINRKKDERSSPSLILVDLSTSAKLQQLRPNKILQDLIGWELWISQSDPVESCSVEVAEVL